MNAVNTYASETELAAKRSSLSEINSIAWKRFKIIRDIMADLVSRTAVTIFYVTILVPFGIISRVFTDPLRRHLTQASSTYWVEREPVRNDLDGARKQG